MATYYNCIHHNLIRDESYITMDEADGGQWATRKYCEQLEKERDEWRREAVEMAKLAKLAKEEREFHLSMLPRNMGDIDRDVKLRKAQAIIGKEEGKG